MELFLTQLFGIYFLIFGIIVLVRRGAMMPAVRELLRNRSLLIVLGAIELAAGIALILAYPTISFSGPGFISLGGWMMAVESIVYLALPLSQTQKLVAHFNKPNTYLWGGIACLLLGLYLTGVGFGFVV